MSNLESILKSHEGKISFARYIIFPIIVAAAFFFLDARYLTKAEFIAVTGDNKAVIVQLAAEQKSAFVKLTDSITGLTSAQRDSVEAQRIAAITLQTGIVRMDKHEAGDTPLFDKINNELEKREIRINSLEKMIERHEVTINRNTDIINKVIMKQ